MKRFTIFSILMIPVVLLCHGTDLIITGLCDSAVFYRPQTPKPPFPYIVEDVSYFNQSKSIQFGGTLTIPENGDKHPVAILIPGTGQADKDATHAGHKLFLVIADHLTKNGIAVLRVDDRGVGDTSGKETVADATSYDYAMDVADGITFLKSHQSIDTTKIGLIGHSGGAIIASILGAERKDIAFIVSMAGVSISGKEAYLSQSKTKLQWLYPSHNTDSILKYESAIIDIIKEEKDNEIAREKIRELLSYELLLFNLSFFDPLNSKPPL